ncbi:MAG: hypothetical protein HZA50_03735 [Planctomycetes bacterium]|nr:hypothetical protein [Planctomycetota bacterium]
MEQAWNLPNAVSQSYSRPGSIRQVGERFVWVEFAVEAAGQCVSDMAAVPMRKIEAVPGAASQESRFLLAGGA